VDEEAAMATVLGGAQGYLLKEIKKDALISAIKAVAQGQSIQDPSVVERVRQKVYNLSQGEEGAKETPLSPQEQKVLAGVADGKTNKEIAFALCLNEKTVKNYLRNIFQKMNVTRRSQAVAKFTRRTFAKKPPEEY
jgi:DNA-binding NarL/FixJ family response regulator